MPLKSPIFLAITFIVCFACASNASDLPVGVSQNLVLAPGPNNPRNSEGDFAVLGDGRVLFIYTRFTGGTGDADAAELVSRLSTDGGKTWSARDERVVAWPAGVQNIMSVSILPLRDGRLAMFYLEKKSAADCRAVMRVSTDGAKRWREPRLCMPEAGYFVVNNGRAIQLADGRIILPAAKHDAATDKPGWHRGVAICFFSDDAGDTWHRSSIALEAPPQSHSGLQEPLVAELKDRGLLMLCRTDQGFLFRSYSKDRGQTWSPAEPSDLASPLSPASLKRIPKTGDLLLVWNDHTAIDAAHRGKRTPLTVAVSGDEGKTWTHRKTLYDDPQGWYCYCAIAFAGERVLLGHCAGLQTKTSSGLATTAITSFDVDWLYR